MEAAQLAISYTAGALALLSPCSLPMLPAYLTYYIERGDDGGSLWSGLVLSTSTIVGFLIVFMALGILPSLIIGEFVRWVWIATPLIGLSLIILGLLTGWTRILNRWPSPVISLIAKGKLSFLLYGVAYGVASLGCSLPVFILVVLQGASVGNLGEVFMLFAAFGGGAATLIIPLTVSLSLAKDVFRERLMRAMPHISKANGVVLIIAGTYMLWKGLAR